MNKITKCFRFHAKYFVEMQAVKASNCYLRREKRHSVVKRLALVFIHRPSHVKSTDVQGQVGKV